MNKNRLLALFLVALMLTGLLLFCADNAPDRIIAFFYRCVGEKTVV